MAENYSEQMDSLVGNLRDDGVKYVEAVREFKKRFIVKTLTRNNWNICKAARELFMHRNTLTRAMEELSIVKPAFKLQSYRKRPVGSAAALAQAARA